MSARRARRGLTLIEVMAAIVILLVMSLLSWEALSASMQINDLLALGDETSRTARVALARMRRELQLAWLTKATSSVTYKTVFVGMDDDPDRLYFATLAHERVYRNSRECDQAEVTIWTDRAPREQGKGFILYHRESPRIDEEPDEQGTVYPLAYNVQTFNVRYLDSNDNEWKEEWDSRVSETTNRLPRAAQIGLVLLGPDPDDRERSLEYPFLTTVIMEYGPRLKQDLLSSGGGR